VKHYNKKEKCPHEFFVLKILLFISEKISLNKFKKTPKIFKDFRVCKICYIEQFRNTCKTKELMLEFIITVQGLIFFTEQINICRTKNREEKINLTKKN